MSITTRRRKGEQDSLLHPSIPPSFSFTVTRVLSRLLLHSLLDTATEREIRERASILFVRRSKEGGVG